MAEESLEEREERALNATTLEELEILVKDDESSVRSYVAANEIHPNRCWINWSMTKMWMCVWQ